MGDAAENPSAMPLVLLHDFYFVRRKETEAEVSINGKQHQIDNLPVPMDGTRMTFIRYSPRPLIATCNPGFDGELPYLAAVAGVFKKWPATYEWNATISETSDDTYHMVSGWKRINRRL